jgi:hypothetical protein
VIFDVTDIRDSTVYQHILFMASFVSFLLLSAMTAFAALLFYEVHTFVYFCCLFLCRFLKCDWFFLFVFRQYNNMAAYVPLILHCTLVAIILCPINVFYLPSRVFVLSILGQNAFSPFSTVAFNNFFIADFVVSHIRSVQDFIFSLCLFASSDFLTFTSATCTANLVHVQYLLVVLPFYWRFAQCLRYAVCW